MFTSRLCIGLPSSLIVWTSNHVRRCSLRAGVTRTQFVADLLPLADQGSDKPGGVGKLLVAELEERHEAMTALGDCEVPSVHLNR